MSGANYVCQLLRRYSLALAAVVVILYAAIVVNPDWSMRIAIRRI